MKIRQITLENFKSYRDKQTIQFSIEDAKPITIIEGKNGHGKSNLLNAFYWCLFDQFWNADTNELITSPDPDHHWLFNKGILKDNRHEGEDLQTFVEIEFLDDNGNKYKVKRSQSGYFIKNNWQLQRHSELDLERINGLDGTSKFLSGDEAKTEIEKLIPTSLSNYFFFRGENRAELVQLQGKTKFQDALGELSKIVVFNRSVNHLISVRDDLRKEIAEEADEELKAKMKNALGRKKDGIKVLEDFKNALIELEKTEQKKKEDYERYRDKIKANQHAWELKVKVEKEEGERTRLGGQLDRIHEERRKSLTVKWGGLVLKGLVQRVEERYQVAVNSGVYPPDIQSSVVDKILNELSCLCGRGFEENSKEYRLIERLKEVGSYDHLLQEIESLMGDVKRVNNKLKQYPEEIKNQSNQETHLKNEITDCINRIETYKQKIGDTSEDLNELQNRQDAAKTEQEKTQNKIKETKDLIESKVKELDGIEGELEGYQKKIKNNKLPSIKIDLAEKALREARKLKRSYEKSIYEDLEMYTQEHWDILVYDKLSYDKISLKPDEMYFEVFDKDGNPTRSVMNTAHSILLVLSFISALIRIAKETWKEEYPLVMDAPTSELGDSALQAALVGFTKVFNQTILILKDGSVASKLPTDLSQNVGKRYWIELDTQKQHSTVTPKELVNA